MTKIEKGARFISKYSDSSNIKPTIPSNDDHTTGWNSTDIYIGEWYFNTKDSTAYFRSDDGIFKVVTVQIKDSTGSLVENNKIPVSLLPGNYMGAMLYRGTWDASTGSKPGIEYNVNYTPDNGDYFIVSVSGTTNPGDPLLVSDTYDWQVGDFVIYTASSVDGGVGWEKIDNTEQIVYASAVVYANNNNYFPNLKNTQAVLDDIYYKKYLVPRFDNYLNINKGATIKNNDSSDSIFTISGSTNTEDFIHLTGGMKKWMTYDENEMSIGSYNGNNILNIGPYSYNGVLSLTNTVNFRYTTSITQNIKWSVFSSESDGYIKGYNSLSETVKISSNSNSYLAYGLGVGVGLNVNGLLGGTMLQLNKENDNSSIVLSRGGNNPTSNTNIGNISFYQDYNSNPLEYAKMNVKTSSQATVTTFGFSVKSNDSLTEGFTILGTSTQNLTYIGINKTLPTVALDVVGDTSISSILTVNGRINANDNIYVNNKLLDFTITNSGDFMSINGNKMYFSYDNNNNTLYIKDINHNAKVSYNLVTGFGLSNTDIAFTNSKISGAKFTSFTVDSVSTYANTITANSFTTSYDLVHKEYVDYQIFTHSVGFFISGQTVDVADKDVVLYNNSTNYYMGINIFDPVYNLDVKGTARISNYLLVTGSGATIDSTLNVNSGVTFNNNAIIKGNLIIGNGNASSKLHVYDNSPYVNLQNASYKNNSGDILSLINFGDQYSTEQAIIKVIRSAESGSINDVPTSMLFYTTSDSTGVAVERMRIDHNGNVGIGQLYPNAKLDIYNSGSYNTIQMNGDGGFTPIVINNKGHVGIGGVSNVSGYVFNVTGNTYFEGNNNINGKILVNNYVGIGGDISSTHSFFVNGKSKFLDNVGIGTDADSTNKLKIVGDTYMTGVNVFTSSLSIGNVLNNAPDSNGLYVQGTSKFNGHVGINAAPDITHNLYVNGKTYFDGNVGIGITSNPLYSLYTLGDIKTEQTLYAKYIDISGVTAQKINSTDATFINVSGTSIKVSDLLTSKNINVTDLTGTTIYAENINCSKKLSVSGITAQSFTTSSLTATGNTIYSGLISTDTFITPFKNLIGDETFIFWTGDTGYVDLNFETGFNWCYQGTITTNVVFSLPSDLKYNGVNCNLFNKKTISQNGDYYIILGNFIYKNMSKTTILNRIDLTQYNMANLTAIDVDGTLYWYVLNSNDFTISGTKLI